MPTWSLFEDTNREAADRSWWSPAMLTTGGRRSYFSFSRSLPSSAACSIMFLWNHPTAGSASPVISSVMRYDR